MSDSVPLPRHDSLGLIQYAGVDMLQYAAAVSAADNADIQKLYLDTAEKVAAKDARIKVLKDALRPFAFIDLCLDGTPKDFAMHVLAAREALGDKT